MGQAIIVFDAIDAEAGTTGFVPRSTRGTLTVNVRPINDAPRLNPTVVSTSKVTNADEAWSVAANGTIRYTMKEDNVGANGVSTPYIIDTRRSVATADRIGLLDPFTVGPSNEADATLGGSQSLRIIGVPVLTRLGGTLTIVARDSAGFPTRLSYVPPINYNSDQGGVDSFDYVFEDNAATTTGSNIGETWNLNSGTLIEDRLTRTGTVEFLINPVNDKPSFTIPNREFTVLEDAGDIVSPLFATNITKGSNAADDEASQTVTFTLTAQGSENGLFRVAPKISPTGTLTFTPTADAVGSVVYVVGMVDSGLNDPTRGDINAANPVTITVNVRPVNDAPILNGSVIGTSNSITPDDSWAVNNAGVITYTMAETKSTGGAAFVMNIRTTANRIGLLDPYLVGPANEVDSTLGGTQLLRIKSVPTTTALGGTLTVLARDANNFPTQISYTPPTNFNLLQSPRDSFTYEIEDDATGTGETWSLSTGRLIENRLGLTGRVEFT